MSESETVRVVIVDDHAMVRESITMALERNTDIDVVGAAGSKADAMAMIDEVRPDVAIVDYSIPGGTGVELAVEIHERQPEVRTIILTAAEGAQTAAEAVAAGCAGFVRKSADLGELAAGVRRVHQGDALFDVETLTAAMGWLKRTDSAAVELTDREREVLGLLAAGRTTKEISEELFLSHHTARNHVRNILTKLDARSQLEAVVIAADLGIVEVGRA